MSDLWLIIKKTVESVEKSKLDGKVNFERTLLGEGMIFRGLDGGNLERSLLCMSKLITSNIHHHHGDNNADDNEVIT